MSTDRSEPDFPQLRGPVGPDADYTPGVEVGVWMAEFDLAPGTRQPMLNHAETLDHTAAYQPAQTGKLPWPVARKSRPRQTAGFASLAMGDGAVFAEQPWLKSLPLGVESSLQDLPLLSPTEVARPEELNAERGTIRRAVARRVSPPLGNPPAIGPAPVDRMAEVVEAPDAPLGPRDSASERNDVIAHSGQSTTAQGGPLLPTQDERGIKWAEMTLEQLAELPMQFAQQRTTGNDDPATRYLVSNPGYALRCMTETTGLKQFTLHTDEIGESGWAGVVKKERRWFAFAARAAINRPDGNTAQVNDLRAMWIRHQMLIESPPITEPNGIDFTELKDVSAKDPTSLAYTLRVHADMTHYLQGLPRPSGQKAPTVQTYLNKINRCMPSKNALVGIRGLMCWDYPALYRTTSTRCSTCNDYAQKRVNDFAALEIREFFVSGKAEAVPLPCGQRAKVGKDLDWQGRQILIGDGVCFYCASASGNSLECNLHDAVPVPILALRNLSLGLHEAVAEDDPSIQHALLRTLTNYIARNSQQADTAFRESQVEVIKKSKLDGTFVPTAFDMGIGGKDVLDIDDETDGLNMEHITDPPTPAAFLRPVTPALPLAESSTRPQTRHESKKDRQRKELEDALNPGIPASPLTNLASSPAGGNESTDDGRGMGKRGGKSKRGKGGGGGRKGKSGR